MFAEAATDNRGITLRVKDSKYTAASPQCVITSLSRASSVWLKNHWASLCTSLNK